MDRRSPAEVGLSAALVLFPLLASIRLTSKLELVCLAALVVIGTIGKPIGPLDQRRLVPLALMVVVCGGLGFAHGATRGEVVRLALTALAVIVASRRVTREVALRSLVAGMSLYLVGNIAGYLLGVESPAARVRVGLLQDSESFLGFRVIFPFVRSINEPAIVAAALIAFVIVSIRVGRAPRWWEWCGVPAGVFVIVASGSRFPVLVLAAVLAASLLSTRLARGAAVAAVAAVAAPFVYASLAGPLAAASERLAGVTFLSRGQTSTDLAGGSFRSIIWQTGLDYWARVDPIHHLYGYGENGHVGSGVVFQYYHRSDDFFLSSPLALTLHNSYLQQMFDTGYLGLAALVAALVITALRFARWGDPATCAAIAVLVATSAVEVYLVPTFRATPFELLLALSVAAPTRLRGLGEQHLDDVAGVPVGVGGTR